MDSGPSKNPSPSEQAPSNSSMCPYQVSKAARQEKRFQDYNERCTFHHQARVSSGQQVTALGGPVGSFMACKSHGWDCTLLLQEFAVNLRNQASAIHEVPPPKSFTFLHDACRALEQARKVVAVGEANGREGTPRGLNGLG